MSSIQSRHFVSSIHQTVYIYVDNSKIMSVYIIYITDVHKPRMSKCVIYLYILICLHLKMYFVYRFSYRNFISSFPKWRSSTSGFDIRFKSFGGKTRIILNRRTRKYICRNQLQPMILLT